MQGMWPHVADPRRSTERQSVDVAPLVVVSVRGSITTERCCKRAGVLAVAELALVQLRGHQAALVVLRHTAAAETSNWRAITSSE